MYLTRLQHMVSSAATFLYRLNWLTLHQTYDRHVSFVRVPQIQNDAQIQIQIHTHTNTHTQTIDRPAIDSLLEEPNHKEVGHFFYKMYHMPYNMDWIRKIFFLVFSSKHVGEEMM